MKKTNVAELAKALNSAGIPPIFKPHEYPGVVVSVFHHSSFRRLVKIKGLLWPDTTTFMVKNGALIGYGAC